MFTREQHLSFSRGEYERVWLDDAHTTCTHKKVRDHFYEVDLINEELIKVTRDGESKTVLVRWETDDYVYRCKKTYIRARRGAEGLFETLERCFNDDGSIWNSATLYTVCDHIIDTMKPAPKRPPMTMNRERVLDALTWSANNKGCGADVADGWLAYADYRPYVSCAELWHSDSRTRIVFPLASMDDELGKKAFLLLATDFLMDKYEDMMRDKAA